MVAHGEAGGTTVLVVLLADGRVVEVTASDNTFSIDEFLDDDDDAQSTVDVDGLSV